MRPMPRFTTQQRGPKFGIKLRAKLMPVLLELALEERLEIEENTKIIN
jgi:hypothetical protein